MSGQPKHVLFLCTGNSARSIIGEVLLNARAKKRADFIAHSAGSHPTGHVNPMTIELLRRSRLPTDGLRSKSWSEFAQPDAPKLDFVFTVCDNAAGEVCPVWPGQPVTAHWGVEDPAAVEGDDETKRKAFMRAFTTLQRRLELFLSLPLEKLDRLALKERLDSIGKS
jgi:arsenate reductase (thioredoxin)